jgi:hypothetical protein
MRYENAEDTSGIISQIHCLVSSSQRDAQRSREEAKKYLEEYGDEFWQTTDTRIKKLVEEFESKITGDAKINASLNAGFVSVGSTMGGGAEFGHKNKVEAEVVERAQRIVSDYLIADLRKIVDLLAKAGFNNSQQRYFIVIDDLDKNWMPDDELYLAMVKSLLFTVYELNRTSPLRGIKVIVSIRENIYHRVFQKVGIHEPQREKWLDVQARLLWTKDELVELVNRRLVEVLRGEYTQSPPTLPDILPPNKKKHDEEAVDFILERTFLRPRDVLDYLNTCLRHVVEKSSSLGWSTLTQSETEFSQRRLDSVLDEWKDSFYGLPAMFSMLRRIGPSFSASEIADDDVDNILTHDRCDTCPWLKNLREAYLSNRITINDIKLELLRAVYLVGLVGYKQPDDGRLVFAFEKPLSTSASFISTTEFQVHLMFWSAFHFSLSQTGATD